jgi:NTP pyrophosphatase (non-canonical NTP hydrolase)
MLKQLGAAFSLASAAYADMHQIERDRDWFVLKMHEELGELTQIWNRLTGRGRLKGQSVEDLQRALSDETADLLGHIFLCRTARYRSCRRDRTQVEVQAAGRDSVLMSSRIESTVCLRSRL